MRREIALAGFVMTSDEWEALDATARAQLLAVALRGDLFIAPAPPPPRRRDDDEPYAAYELVPVAA